MRSIKDLNINWLIFLATVLLFLAPISDADLGWHLRYGDYFWDHGSILFQNTFSWTLPDYRWINHSWAYDLIISIVFKYFGFVGLSVLGAFVIAGAVTIIIRAIPHIKLKLLGWLLTIFISYPLLHTGIKSQHFSLLATALLWWLLTTKLYLRFFFTLPMLFLLWANMHGQFILGLILLWLYIGGSGLSLWWQWATEKISHKELLPARRELIHESFIGVISTAVTVLNPFGWDLHQDLINYTNAEILAQVTEWQPWPMDGLLPLLFLLYTLLLAFLALKTFSQYPAQWLIVFSLGYLAFTARRIIPTYLLVSLLPLAITIPQIFPKLLSNEKKYLEFGRAAISFFVLILIFRTMNNQTLWQQNWNTYCDTEIQCSESAVNFLRENNIQGKIFNAYRLGGHLIVRYPEQPVYIDGRMTLWQQNQYVPFAEYSNIIYALPEGKEQFEQLNPDYVLINHQYPLAEILETVEKWPIMYQDEKVVLFQHPQK